MVKRPAPCSSMSSPELDSIGPEPVHFRNAQGTLETGSRAPLQPCHVEAEPLMFPLALQVTVLRLTRALGFTDHCSGEQNRSVGCAFLLKELTT